ncbi:MAG: hypothetical protein SWY16_03325 [Cyanobacteriota bacterium]|nr:hypothetical protein [Cyanobacteriota bacterium]
MMTQIWCSLFKPNEGRLLTSFTLLLWLAIATAAFARYNPPPQPPPKDPGGSTSLVSPVKLSSSVGTSMRDFTEYLADLLNRLTLSNR